MPTTDDAGGRAAAHPPACHSLVHAHRCMRGAALEAACAVWCLLSAVRMTQWSASGC